MKPAQAQLFLSVVLLEAVREDIRENKKLNVQYYEALKRALYKPSAFFKGILFPMLTVRALVMIHLYSSYHFSKGVPWGKLLFWHPSWPKWKYLFSMPLPHRCTSRRWTIQVLELSILVFPSYLQLSQVPTPSSFGFWLTKSSNSLTKLLTPSFFISSNFPTPTNHVVVTSLNIFQCSGIRVYSLSCNGGYLSAPWCFWLILLS